MQIQKAIEHLQSVIDSGDLKPEDEVAFTWWSYLDVDVYQDDNLTLDECRQVWANVMEKLMYVDDISDSDMVNDLIFEMMEKFIQKRDGNE